ncbi:MAG: hypothetical protein NTZ57_07995 [Deltaproteobacteria bacterium]|nr:hypothetical protein [Deltaproteobacteria bacterium]
MFEPLLMNLENNVYLEDEALIIIDRRKLPGMVMPVYCTEAEEVARAIRELQPVSVSILPPGGWSGKGRPRTGCN